MLLYLSSTLSVMHRTGLRLLQSSELGAHVNKRVAALSWGRIGARSWRFQLPLFKVRHSFLEAAQSSQHLKSCSRHNNVSVKLVTQVQSVRVRSTSLGWPKGAEEKQGHKDHEIPATLPWEAAATGRCRTWLGRRSAVFLESSFELHTPKLL